MQPDDVAFLKAMIMLVVAGVFGVAVYWLRLRHRGQSRPELEQEVAAMGEDHAALREALEARLAELENRLDFAERQLVQRPPAPRLVERPARTPV
jgi:Tfp pilus assembly protein PilO